MHLCGTADCTLTVHNHCKVNEGKKKKTTVHGFMAAIVIEFNCHRVTCKQAIFKGKSVPVGKIGLAKQALSPAHCSLTQRKKKKKKNLSVLVQRKDKASVQ